MTPRERSGDFAQVARQVAKEATADKDDEDNADSISEDAPTHAPKEAAG